MAAYDVEKENDTFSVTYEQPGLYTFWKSFDETFNYSGADTVYIYTSIFAPADLKKSVLHHWQWFNSETESWNTTDKISYEVTGGRRGGYRGYTFKENIWPGRWKVDVTTGEGLVLGALEFHIVADSTRSDLHLTTQEFH